MFATEAVVVAQRMFSMPLAEAIVISPVAQPMVRMLPAEAVVVTPTIISMPLTEFVIIIVIIVIIIVIIVITPVAQAMSWMPLAEAHQGDQLGAQPVAGMPATK